MAPFPHISSMLKLKIGNVEYEIHGTKKGVSDTSVEQQLYAKEGLVKLGIDKIMIIFMSVVTRSNPRRTTGLCRYTFL
jgi:hypothetical protein